MLESPFNKLARFKTCNFLKKRLQHGCFPVSIAKFLRTLILIKICEQLLLPFLLLTVNIPSQGLLQQAFFKGPLQGLKSSPQGAQWQAPLLFEKKKNQPKQSLTVTRCHSLSLVVIRCHSLSLVALVVFGCTTCCHSLLLVVIRCYSMYHSIVSIHI